MSRPVLRDGEPAPTISLPVAEVADRRGASIVGAVPRLLPFGGQPQPKRLGRSRRRSWTATTTATIASAATSACAVQAALPARAARDDRQARGHVIRPARVNVKHDPLADDRRDAETAPPRHAGAGVDASNSNPRREREGDLEKHRRDGRVLKRSAGADLRRRPARPMGGTSPESSEPASTARYSSRARAATTAPADAVTASTTREPDRA